MLNKRAQAGSGEDSLIEQVIEAQGSLLTSVLFFGLLTIVGMFIVTSSIDRGSWFEKRVVANDVGSLLDGMQLFQGNVIFTYTRNTSYVTNLSQGSITIFDDAGKEDYPFVEDGSARFTYGERRLPFVMLKEGQDYRLERSRDTFNHLAIPCEEVPHQPLSQVALDGDGTEVMKTLVLRLHSFNSPLFSSTGPLRDDGSLPHASQNLGIVLSLRLRQDTGIVKVFFRALPAYVSENQLLACRILNKLSRGKEGAAIVPLSQTARTPTSIDESAYRVPTLVVELPSDSDPAVLAQAIYEGLQQYGVQTLSS